MSNADKILCPVKPQGEYEPPESLPVSCGSHATHKCKLVCLHKHTTLHVGSKVHTCMHTGVCAQVHQWLLFGHVLAGALIIFGIACLPCPSAESARGQVGPGNLSQLLCPVSGKPPAGVLPTEPACLCTCPLGFQEGPRRPSPQPCMPESTALTHTMQGGCNPLPPTLTEPLTVRTRRESSRAKSASGVKAYAHAPWCMRGSLHTVGICRHRGSA